MTTGRRGGFLALCALGLLGACATNAPGDAGSFALEDFFAGESVSAGEIRTLPFGLEAFTARFQGEASAEGFRLEERFSFEDGERLQVWELSRIAPDRYAGAVRTETGDGALREARPVDGRLTPEGAVLDYQGYAPGGGGTLFHFRHRMTAQDDGTVRNRVTISKFGLPLARADVLFAKDPAALSRP